MQGRRNGGRTWGEQAGVGGGGWNADDDVIPIQRVCDRSRLQTSVKIFTRSRVPPLPVGVSLNLELLHVVDVSPLAF